MRAARFGIAIAVAAALFAACGEDRSPAEKALGDAEDKLEDVRSGHMDFELLASTEDAARGQGVGFLLEGRFAVGSEKGDLPVADLEYTRVTGTARRMTRFISTGKEAFVRLDGRLVELTDDQVEGMRVRDGDQGAGLDGLSLSDWVEKPSMTRGPTVDGVPTDRIKGAVDAVPAINDLVALATEFGMEDDDVPGKLEGDDADRVRRAARASSVEILTGRTDKLLRRLELVIELSAGEVDERVRRALRGLSGTTLRLSIDLTDVNERVRVESPR